jgi:hypothetical protein
VIAQTKLTGNRSSLGDEVDWEALATEDVDDVKSVGS